MKKRKRITLPDDLIDEEANCTVGAGAARYSHSSDAKVAAARGERRASCSASDFRKRVEQAKAEIVAEDRAQAAREEELRLSRLKLGEERRDLPPEHPDHTCGMFCDGQDGRSSQCWRLREKLGYHK